MRIGTVDSLWRYPVKSMRGEELERAFVGFPGIYGDRIFAFTSTANSPGFPFFTGRDQQKMLTLQPRFKDSIVSAEPPNLAQASSMGSGVTAIYGSSEELAVEIEDASGKTFRVDDPELSAMLLEGTRDGHSLTLIRSDRALTDCRPVSLFSMQTVRQIGREVGEQMDHRRFRANIYADLESEIGFAEDLLVGRSLRIGSKTVIAVLARDARCKMITLDSQTGEANPEIMRQLSNNHEGKAGVYCAVLVEGIINKGDPIELVDQ